MGLDLDNFTYIMYSTGMPLAKSSDGLPPKVTVRKDHTPASSAPGIKPTLLDESADWSTSRCSVVLASKEGEAEITFSMDAETTRRIRQHYVAIVG